MRSRLIALWIALFVSGLMLSVALYSPGFRAPMYYDSQRIEKNSHVFAHQGLLETIRIFPQRPLAMASFYLDFSLAGMSPYYFRFVNAVLLAITSLLVAVFVHIGLEGTAGSQRSGAAERLAVAIFCGLAFLLHPIQIFLVEYIWQRMALLACLFFMLTLVAYFADRPTAFENSGRRHLVCFILFLMAMASKETAITLPLVLVLTERAMRYSQWTDLRKTIAFGAAMLVASVILASFLERPHGVGQQPSGVLNTITTYYAESGITLWQALITQCRMVWSYVQLIVFPLPSQLQLISPQAISQGLFEPLTSAFAVAATVLLGVAGLYLLRLRRLSGFGILFFLVTLAPEAVLVPQYMFFVYRGSLPMIGVLCVVADCALALLQRVAHSKARCLGRCCLAALAVGGLLFLGVVSHGKAQWWCDGLRVWGDALEGLPEDLGHIQKDSVAQAFQNLGAMLSAQGKHDEAIRVQQRALKLIPANQYAYNSLGLAFMSKKDYEAAVENFTRAIEVSPYYVDAHYNLGRSLAFQGKREEAAAQFNKTLALNPNYWKAYNDLGVIAADAGEIDRATALFQAALAIRPDYQVAQQNLLGLLMKKRSLR
jgi:protein O-mannosyl-transferase